MRRRLDCTIHGPTKGVSTLIPREAGCDKAMIDFSAKRDKMFQPSSRARRDATGSVADDAATVRIQFQPSSRARRDATRQ